MEPRRQPIQACVWQSIPLKGAEYGMLWRTDEGWLLKGTSVGVAPGERPFMAAYEIHCDEHWRTRHAIIESTAGIETALLRAWVAEPARWTVNNREYPSLDGCIDIDFGLTPATNTLPIRRMKLGVGESVDLMAVWIRFPDFGIQPLRQRYTRLDLTHYRYESGTGFSAVIEVDELGLVRDYPGGWRRLA